MKNIKYIFGILSLILLLMVPFACKRQDILLQTDSSASAPQQISGVKIENLPGAAKITYKLPDDPNLLYVKAEYEVAPGQKYETKSSGFIDTLLVSGFGDTLVHDIKLYSVGRNNKASEPLTVQVNPLTPPVRSVFKTLTLQATFSGALVSFQNDPEAPLAMVVLTDSTGNGDWITVNTYYTQVPKGSFAVRGFDSVDRKFAVYIRDRWGNRSDTLVRTLKPLYEEQISKAKFAEVDLPTDDYAGHIWSSVPTVRQMSFLWNGIWNNGSDVFHTKPSDPRMPQWFTFDMGAKYTLSRFKFYHRASSDGRYTGGDPQIFEIYGSNDPDPDGGWNNWTLLGHFTSIKPSGGSAITADDIQFACVDGEDFDFPLGIPPVRYLRWKTLQTWGGFKYIFISELTFWGTTAQ